MSVYKTKKMKTHTCKGCVNNGLPMGMCDLFNKEFKRDCGADKLIYIKQERKTKWTG